MAFPAQKAFKPIPPLKGSFPLDHNNECRVQMMSYMKCLQENNYSTENCRVCIKNYLECRMENGLMAKEPWDSLGLKEFQEKEQNVETV